MLLGHVGDLLGHVGDLLGHVGDLLGHVGDRDKQWKNPQISELASDGKNYPEEVDSTPGLYQRHGLAVSRRLHILHDGFDSRLDRI